MLYTILTKTFSDAFMCICMRVCVWLGLYLYMDIRGVPKPGSVLGFVQITSSSFLK